MIYDKRAVEPVRSLAFDSDSAGGKLAARFDLGEV